MRVQWEYVSIKSNYKMARLNTPHINPQKSAKIDIETTLVEFYPRYSEADKKLQQMQPLKW
jgi:hypothetical protein